jgi:8-amino-7-oxononanoate synthase
VLIGDNGRALAAAETLKSRGILAVAIRPPTVPEGTARLRLSLTLDHNEGALEWAAAQIIEACT